jgi:flagellar export protein FliJ
MSPFRFRAKVALQLRQREHDEALGALARAQADLARAVQRAELAGGAVRDADERMREASAAPQAGMPLDWYRPWRMRLTLERQRCEAECRAREADVNEATARVASTRLRVRSLERLHDNALAAWKQALHQEEQKTMDVLAALRFTSIQRKESL